MNLQWSKDSGRSLDYLETHKNVDTGKIAYLGFSLAGRRRSHLIAVEPRFKVAVLLLGGSFEKVLPEVDPWNFAARAKIPVLMQNGRDDFFFPLEASQLPLFHLLGTPAKAKNTSSTMALTAYTVGWILPGTCSTGWITTSAP
jgi:dienelactone hydrolase